MEYKAEDGEVKGNLSNTTLINQCWFLVGEGDEAEYNVFITALDQLEVD